MMFTDIFDILDRLKVCSGIEYAENWGHITISGSYNNEDKSIFNDLNTAFVSNNLQSALNFFIGTDYHNIDDFINDLQNSDVWRVNINKEVLIRKKQEDRFHLNFFYSQDEFANWSAKANPFEEAHPFNVYSPIKVIVKDVNYSLGGPNILICNQKDNNLTFAEYNDSMPTNKDILDIVHVITEKPTYLHLERHLITFGDPENQYQMIF